MSTAEKKQGLNPHCSAQSMIVGSCYRFSLLTARLVRMEYDPDGVFEDRPTQMAVNRSFPPVEYAVYETDQHLEIITDALNIFYDKGPFTVHSLQVKVRSECCGIYCTWNYSEPVMEGLGGTAQTLDQADGEIPLEPGIQSRIGGFGVLDDSRSAVIQPDGSVCARRSGVRDVYFFGYGFAYRDCLRDFFSLSGYTPLIPRYALGNWWSRFHPYTDEEYLQLMDRFRAEEIPLSVAVIDMDWHLRNIDPRYGKGWTGFTWNRELIREPAKFLAELHDRALKTTLNLHPAEGIQPHESMYECMAYQLQRDPKQHQPIRFDFCNAAFIHAYFQYVIHPLEKQGVDFWWLDWQQGSISRMPGLDPLWLLNYYHFLDADRGSRRPMILSRYAGPGSQRFPIGFSGDSIISWRSLDFQPYFTANAANIGYGWWSHDIGGHAAGYRDVELQTRWIQFGVFSPILRLHSTSNPFNGKEPWRYPEPAKSIMAEFMRLRHSLIPYLYTMNWRCHAFGELLVEPMYYQYPKENLAYSVKNQYQFGSELIVCPITQRGSPITGRGCTSAWLPENDYFDFFSGTHYRGKRKMNVYRPLQTIPVFAKAGAIIPLTGKVEACKNGTNLPQTLIIRVFAGSDGKFSLYEDDGLTKAYRDGQGVTTEFRFSWKTDTDASVLSIEPDHRTASFLPVSRQYIICFTGVRDKEHVIVTSKSKEITAKKEYDVQSRTLSIVIPAQPVNAYVEICFPEGLSLAKNRTSESLYELLNDCAIAYEQKEQIYHTILSAVDPTLAICELQTMQLPAELMGALMEVMLAE